MESKIINIKMEDLIPFRLHSGQLYQNERLEQLINSMKEIGLISSIIVRPAADKKYEIICGHNQIKIMKALNYTTIPAEVREGLSDNEAIKLFCDSNLNQQSFSSWNYAQRLKAIKYIDQMIRENSQQGKRNDLKEKSDNVTSVQNRQRLRKKSKQNTRDKMAYQLGISTATFSKYRSMIKFSDDLIASISDMLDQKKITFEFAYRMSKLKESEIKWILNHLQKYPDKEIEMQKLKNLCNKSKNNGIEPLSEEEMKKELFSITFKPFRRNDT